MFLRAARISRGVLVADDPGILGSGPYFIDDLEDDFYWAALSNRPLEPQAQTGAGAYGCCQPC